MATRIKRNRKAELEKAGRRRTVFEQDVKQWEFVNELAYAASTPSRRVSASDLIREAVTAGLPMVQRKINGGRARSQRR